MKGDLKTKNKHKDINLKKLNFPSMVPKKRHLVLWKLSSR